MSRLTKAQSRAHDRAEKILAQDVLSDDDKQFVIEHWQESATSVNSKGGAFFTPLGLAQDLTIECGTPASVIDLCAGIGTLSYALHRHLSTSRQMDGDVPEPRIVCVETNPEYVRVGRKILPQAEWVSGSVLAPSVLELGPFDLALSNPPFGRIDRDGDAPRYQGGEFEYHVIDVAAHIAKNGVFILPQMSLAWEYSGKPCYRETSVTKHARFVKQTSIDLAPGCGIDTSVWADDWHLVKVSVEVALADFEEQHPRNERSPATEQVDGQSSLLDLIEEPA